MLRVVIVKILPGKTKGLGARVPVRIVRKRTAPPEPGRFPPLFIVPMRLSVNVPPGTLGPLAVTIPLNGQLT
jgi:hypothetical protein